MKFKQTAIALGIVILVGVYAYFVEYRGGEKKQEQKELSSRVLKFDKEKVTKVSVLFGGELKNKEGFVLEKSGENWLVRGKSTFPADKSNVENVIRNLETVGEETRFDINASVTPDKFGLEPSQISVEIGFTEGDPITVFVGLEVPTQSQSYLRVGAEPVIRIIPNSLRYALDKTVNSFRDAKMMGDVKMDDVAAVRVFGREIKTWEAEKDSSGKFVIKVPIEVPVHRDQWNNWFNLYKNLRSSEFEYDGDMTASVRSKYNLARPDYVVEFLDKDKKKLASLEMGKKLQDPKKPGYFELYAYRPGTTSIRKLGHGQWEKFGKSGDELMTDQPVTLSKADLKEVRIEKGKDSFSLKRDAEKQSWTVSKADGASAAAVDLKVDGLVNDALNLRVQKGSWRRTGSASSVGKPAWKLVFLSERKNGEAVEKEEMSLTIAERTGNQRMVQSSLIPKATFMAVNEEIIKLNGNYEDFLLPKEEPKNDAPPIEGASPASNSQGKGKTMMEPTVADKTKITKLEKAFVEAGKKYTAKFETSKGEFEVEFFSKEAPYTVSNFLNLARNKFYDGLKFHRVIKDFMAQGGDPSGNGSGGPGYKFQDEFSEKKHDRGSLSMANAGPNTNGSQFFICFKPQAHLDGKHSVFGKVTGDGMKVVDQLTNGDVMKTVRVFQE